MSGAAGTSTLFPLNNERRAVIGGALVMAAATLFFTGLDTTLRLLAGRHDVIFLAFGRNLLQAVYLAALIPFVGWRRMVLTRHPAAQVMRGLLLLATTALIVFALKALPMAQTYSITFSTPLFAVLFATIFLRERPSAFRWMCILAGFAGVLVVIGPAAPQASWALLFPLAMALANAAYHVLTRAIAADEDPLAMLFLVPVVASLASGVALPWTWSAMDAGEWAFLAFGAALGTIAHLMLVFAYRLAPTSVVAPMTYAQIVSAIAIGYLVFGEVPSATTLIGAGVVVASGVALLRARR